MILNEVLPLDALAMLQAAVTNSVQIAWNRARNRWTVSTGFMHGEADTPAQAFLALLSLLQSDPQGHGHLTDGGDEIVAALRRRYEGDT